jgi:phosphatidylglycerophosphate synthase
MLPPQVAPADRVASDVPEAAPPPASVEPEPPRGFAARFRQLLVFKSPDVEEPIDMFFHRPLAAAFAALVVELPITPNQVTYSSLIVGLAGSVFLYRAAFLDAPAWNYAVAGLLLFASVILDCADGQLARAKGGGSRMGRILDGLVDMFVLLPAYVILGFGLVRHSGAIWIVIGAVAGISSWARIVIYDKIKSVYLAHTQPSSADGTESIEALEAELAELKATGPRSAYVGMFVYVRVLMRIENRFAPGSAHVRDPGPEARQAFRARHRKTMRWCTWLGLGTHMFFLYVSIILAAWWYAAMPVVQVLFATVFNVLMIAVLLKSRSLRAE